MSHFDVDLDDVARGPEFGTRVMSCVKKLGCKTMRDVEQAMTSGRLAQVKGMGKRSLNEVRDMIAHYNHLDNPQKVLFDDPEETQYRMENYIGSAIALIHDVVNHLVRAALKGRISPESRAHTAMKLRDAADYVEKLPTYSV